MHRLCGLLLLSFLMVVPCAAQGVVNLGVNPETGLNEIRVVLPGLPEDAKPLDMVLIPAGTFTMGSPEDERARGPDETQHEVTIAQPFYLGKYEVTQSQWLAVTGDAPAHDRGVGDDYPVYYVGWNDCQIFIERLNGMEQQTFRLPTETEWEYACRAGTTTRFSFGDAPECHDNCGYCEVYDQNMWWCGNRSLFASEQVGSKLPNPWGLYDMHGNVVEWCSDWYGSYPAGPQTDPQGPTLGSYRVFRGGGWDSGPQNCRSADRGYDPGGRYGDLGLRLLRPHERSAVTDWTEYR